MHDGGMEGLRSECVTLHAKDEAGLVGSATTATGRRCFSTSCWSVVCNGDR
jgi:hypothetical protein